MQEKDPDHVLELKHTIQIMQEHLNERDGKVIWIFTMSPFYPQSIAVSSVISFIYIEAELSKRNSEDNMGNLHLPQNTVVLLKKELSQKTEALNKALKRESELKVS